MNPVPITLAGAYARLEPLTLAHAPELFAVAADDSIWRHMITPAPASVEHMRERIQVFLNAQGAGTLLPFAIVGLAAKRVAGMTTYLNISRPDRGLEIGHTWLGVQYQRTPINTECKFLLLCHAFEQLGAARVQLKTDALNDRSRAAILRIGATFEGILRKYQLTRGGRIRDTAMFSITEDDWPGVRARLEGLLKLPQS